jgi:hypothetical protein
MQGVTFVAQLQSGRRCRLYIKIYKYIYTFIIHDVLLFVQVSKDTLLRLVGTVQTPLVQEDFAYIFNMFEFRDNHIKSQGQRQTPAVEYRFVCMIYTRRLTNMNASL